MTTFNPTTKEPYRYQPDPREFAGELTIHDFSTCHPNTQKKYAYTNKELEIRAAYYKNHLAVKPWQQ